MILSSFTDQMGRTVLLPRPPQRIVSLVPSQTELLNDLGLNTSVVGITKFCIHPSTWRNHKVIVGGTKNFQLDVIEKLKPDLILGNKEENSKEKIESLCERYPVWMSDIFNLDDALVMIKAIATINEKSKEGEVIAQKIAKNFSELKKLAMKSVLYLIWREPWMTVGKNTFIDAMLESIGLRNIVKDQRYPAITLEEMKQLSPQYVFLSSEPYPFKDIHQRELKKTLPESKIILVDGEMFSWYGSRLIKAPDYFRTLKLD